MQSENAAVVRRLYELYDEVQDTPPGPERSAVLAELMALLADDVEYVQVGGPLDVDRVRGKRSFETFWDEWLAVWEHRVSVEEIREDGERLLVLAHERFVPREGMEFENAATALFTVRDGRVQSFTGYRDRDTAIAAFEAGT